MCSLPTPGDKIAGGICDSDKPHDQRATLQRNQGSSWNERPERSGSCKLGNWSCGTLCNAVAIGTFLFGIRYDSVRIRSRTYRIKETRKSFRVLCQHVNSEIVLAPCSVNLGPMAANGAPFAFCSQYPPIIPSPHRYDHGDFYSKGAICSRFERYNVHGPTPANLVRWRIAAASPV